MRVNILTNYITIHITGNELMTFFKRCAQANIPLTDVSMCHKKEAKISVHATHFNLIRNIADELQLQINIKERVGLLFTLMALWQKKERISAIILSCALLFVLSNIVWNVNIVGVPSHIEMKINDYLRQTGIYKGAMFTSRISLDDVEANLMKIVPELLYINVTKHGTIYTIEAKEKKLENMP